MFYKDASGIYRAEPLERFAWLMHGFGTRAASLPGENEHLAILKQIHSGICVTAAGRSGCLGEGDALLENTPGCAVAVKTADCLPILLVDPRNRALAVVHAGWRGTAQKIATSAVQRMKEYFATAPEQLHVAIGPGIGSCCYEVGSEVASQFGRTGKVKLDLAELNRKQLVDWGVPDRHVCLAKLCTMCRPEEFHSYRRDGGKAGRMFSVAGIRAI